MRDVALDQLRLKRGAIGLAQRFRPPLVVVLREYLNAVAGGFPSALDRPMNAPSDRHMSAKWRHDILSNDFRRITLGPRGGGQTAQYPWTLGEK